MLKNIQSIFVISKNDLNIALGILYMFESFTKTISFNDEEFILSSLNDSDINRKLWAERYVCCC